MARPPRNGNGGALPPPPPGVQFSSEPSPEALAFFRNKQSLPSFDYRDVWAEEHAYSFTVAKAMRTEVLESIRRAVDQALANGVPFEQFARELTPRLQRLGWWGSQFVVDPETGEEIIATLGTPHRLRLIYDANIRSAHAAGQWERAQRTKFALPFFLYVQTTSAEPREDHLAQVGTIAHVDDPYWDTWFPPNGWNCKCQVRQISAFEAEKLGPRPPLPVVTRPWINKRTGVVEDIPVGIDPGWHRNPGKLRHANLDELLSGTLDNVDPALRAAALKDLPNSWLFKKIVAGEIDSTPGKPGFFQIAKPVDVAAPVGHFGAELTAAHGGKSGVIWVSGEKTLVPMWQSIPKEHWSLAPRVFDEGAVIRHETEKGFLTVYRTIDGKTYRAEVALRDAMVDGTPYKGGPRLNLETFTVVDAHLARAEIELAKFEGRLARGEAKSTSNMYAPKPASLGAAATPKPEQPKSGAAAPKGKKKPIAELPPSTSPTKAITAARKWLKAASKDGFKHVISHDEAGNFIAGHSSGKALSVTVPTKLFKVKGKVVPIHLHISSKSVTSVSKSDLKLLSSGPIRHVHIHTPDGSTFTARRIGNDLPNHVLTSADAVTKAVKKLVATGQIGQDEAAFVATHAFNKGAAQIGAIKYKATLKKQALAIAEKHGVLIEQLSKLVKKPDYKKFQFSTGLPPPTAKPPLPGAPKGFKGEVSPSALVVDNLPTIGTELVSKPDLDEFMARSDAVNKRPELRSAVRQYTGSGYRALNTYLRKKHGSKDLERTIKNIDKAIAVRIPKGMVLFRGVKLPAEAASQIEVGAVFRDPGYLSTTKRRRFAEQWGGYQSHIFVIKAEGASGLDVATISQYANESEIILARNTKLRVTHVEKSGHHVYVHMVPEKD